MCNNGPLRIKVLLTKYLTIRCLVLVNRHYQWIDNLRQFSMHDYVIYTEHCHQLNFGLLLHISEFI